MKKYIKFFAEASYEVIEDKIEVLVKQSDVIIHDIKFQELQERHDAQGYIVVAVIYGNQPHPK